MQRYIDIFVAGLGMVLLSPLLFLLVIVLRFTGEGEIFYRQSRIGLHGKVFDIYKFATMLKNSPNIGAGTLTMKDDQRVLYIGSFLRRTKINELPQLLNILFGDMSLVGPRPLVPNGEANYTAAESKVIRSVLPGVTGIGSLVLRDEESYYAHRTDAHDFYKQVISPYKSSLEIWYVKNRSIFLNIKIITFTAIAIFFPYIDLKKYFFNIPPMPPELTKSKI